MKRGNAQLTKHQKKRSKELLKVYNLWKYKILKIVIGHGKIPFVTWWCLIPDFIFKQFKKVKHFKKIPTNLSCHFRRTKIFCDETLVGKNDKYSLTIA